MCHLGAIFHILYLRKGRYGRIDCTQTMGQRNWKTHLNCQRHQFHRGMHCSSVKSSHQSRYLVGQISENSPATTAGRTGFERAVTTGRTGVEIVNARYQSVATGCDGPRPVTGGTTVSHRWRADGHTGSIRLLGGCGTLLQPLPISAQGLRGDHSCCKGKRERGEVFKR